MIRLTLRLIVMALIGTGAIAGPTEDGARIFNEGLLPDGSPLKAIVAQGARLSGKIAACARCHRASGYLGALSRQ